MRCDYAHFHSITTRWLDNDAYGHVNNVVYYSWFDTVVNQFLISNGVLDPATSAVIGLVIETQCNYFSPVSFPELVTAGLRVGRLGNSSVRYEVAIFRGEEECAIAHGHFIHVYVDRVTRRPVQQLPAALRALLQTIDRSAPEFTPSTEMQ
jgi:acyl-CoA thioester hydrolase